MKLIPVGFVTAIVILSGLSASIAQERYQESSGDRSQYGNRQGDRDQATDGQSSERRENDNPRSRGDANGSHAGDAESIQAGEITPSGAGQIARFRFARGSSRFDIRCPANERMRECLEAASQFIRQMGQTPDLIEKGADKGYNSDSKQQ